MVRLLPALAMPALLLRSRTARAAIALTKPASVLPRGAEGAVMTFNEEFRHFVANADGAGGWKTRFHNGDRTLASNHELEFYADAAEGGSPFRIVDDRLEITATRQAMPGGLTYRSGLITSQTIFSQRHGYFEMRARLPAGRGIWPAFWLLPDGGGWPPEIDVIEMLGHEPQALYASVHWQDGAPKGDTQKIRVADMSQDFHIYGAAWRDDAVTWYFDGREIARVATPAGFREKMYLLVNLAVGGEGSWPGAPDGRTVFPARMLVDWVRAWQFG